MLVSGYIVSQPTPTERMLPGRLGRNVRNLSRTLFSYAARKAPTEVKKELMSFLAHGRQRTEPREGIHILP